MSQNYERHHSTGDPSMSSADPIQLNRDSLVGNKMYPAKITRRDVLKTFGLVAGVIIGDPLIQFMKGSGEVGQLGHYSVDKLGVENLRDISFVAAVNVYPQETQATLINSAILSFNNDTKEPQSNYWFNLRTLEFQGDRNAYLPFVVAGRRDGTGKIFRYSIWNRSSTSTLQVPGTSSLNKNTLIAVPLTRIDKKQDGGLPATQISVVDGDRISTLFQYVYGYTWTLISPFPDLVQTAGNPGHADTISPAQLPIGGSIASEQAFFTY